MAKIQPMSLARKPLIALIAVSLLGLTVGLSRADDGSSFEAADEIHKIEFPVYGGALKGVPGHATGSNPSNNLAGTAAAIAQNGILFHNGSVMNNPNGVDVNLIWYGNWGTDTALTVIPNFLRGLNNSPHFGINSTYTDAANTPITAKINLVGQYVVPTLTYGTILNDSQILMIARASLGLGTIPATFNPNAVYFVLTAQEIGESTGFLSAYCGWHNSEYRINSATSPANNMKFSFVGNGGTKRGCSQQLTSSPNGNIGADGMVSVIAHELEETVTDPDGDGWYASNGSENGDLCAWKFGTTQTLTNTTSTLDISGNVTGASNNGVAAKSASISAATTDGILTNKLVSISNNSTSTIAATSVTFTYSQASNSSAIKSGDLVSIPTLPGAYSGLVISKAPVTSVSGKTFTVAASVSLGTGSLTLPTASTTNVSVLRAGTKITYTISGTNNLAVNDLVTVAGLTAPYNITSSKITAVLGQTFTVNSTSPGGTSPLTAATGNATTPAQAGTTITYSYSGGPFAAGDKVTVTSLVSAYTISKLSISSVQANSFTVSAPTAAGTAAATFAPALSVSTSRSIIVGGSYNMILGGAKYLIQQNWANRAPSGMCALS